MLMIRLKRVGRKHDPSYRVIVTEKHRGPKSGRYIENVGFYDPRKDIKTMNTERIKHWISEGAQLSGTVHNILVSENIVDSKKINVLPKKRPIIKEKEEVQAKKEEAPVEEVKEEIKEAPTSTEGEVVEEKVEDEAPQEEAKEEGKVEEKLEETPEVETPTDSAVEESKE